MSGQDEELAAAKERGWRELAEIDRALDDGWIDEDEWHRRVLALVEPAYLAGSNLQAESGHGGDDRTWEHARRLVLDAVDRDGSFLDVGCANGLLMESVARWAAEDGVVLEPYGVEISPALADLARRRLPRWADRIWTANARDFEPAQRFTYVRTGLDYVPVRRRRAYVEHLLARVVAPGGRLIVGAYNEESAGADLAETVETWGLSVAGRTMREHRHPALAYKAFWLIAE